MVDIEKIIDSINIPKQILDKGELLLKSLFGPSFDELAGMISDQVKLRRFKNQIHIFSKAQDILKEKNINPKKVSLKLLAPLIEYSSYEEDEKIQDKWSQLITHVLSGNKDVIFQQNCISVLNKLATEDVTLIDNLHNMLQTKRNERNQRQIASYQTQLKYFPSTSKPKNPNEYSLNSLVFSIKVVAKALKVSEQSLEFSLSNLVVLGLLKWETDVTVKAAKSSEDASDNNIDVDVDVYNNDDFIFTPLGDKFVIICKDK